MAFFLVLFSGHVATWGAMLSLCFCRMAYNASSMLCRIADNASSMLLLWLLLHGFVKSFGRAFHKSPLNGRPC
jgi:hypothetical protein